jgi:hypothetical protein
VRYHKTGSLSVSFDLGFGSRMQDDWPPVLRTKRNGVDRPRVSMAWAAFYEKFEQGKWTRTVRACLSCCCQNN